MIKEKTGMPIQRQQTVYFDNGNMRVLEKYPNRILNREMSPDYFRF
ncbi:hypothetical protein JXQ31_06785 [candidate division KSB1 bacterium]|nr:hypothetical protein [candidate division KSB1 bacterium]